jgi:divalent metal cation (Fe/Co/Zn/Cd) transporter
VTRVDKSYQTARRVTRASIAVSGILACSNIITGLLTQSTSVVATGFDAGDVLASSIVLIGMGVARGQQMTITPTGMGGLRPSPPSSSARSSPQAA